MATNFSNPDSLDTLTGAVNQALIETGRFFRSSGSVQSQAQLKRGIPAAHEQFQSALDGLSEQIFLAKAFLERDYEAIRATHGRRDSQGATQDVTMEEGEGEETATKHETEPTVPAPETAAESAPEVAATEPAPATAEQQPAVEDNTEKIKTEPQPTTTEEPPAAEPPSQPDNEQAKKPIKTEKAEETAGPDAGASAGVGAGTADVTEGKAEAPGANNNSNDSGGGGVNEFDLHLDFGDDEVGNRNFLSGAFGTTGTGDDGTPDLDHSAATTGGGDAFDMELQKVSGADKPQESQSQPQPQSQPESQPQQAQDMAPSAQVDGPGGGEMIEDVMGPGESSFDDLFLDSENFGGEGDQGLLDGDGLMNMSELDDNWFT